MSKVPKEKLQKKTKPKSKAKKKNQLTLHVKSGSLGRPASYKTPKQMIDKIEEYFIKASSRVREHVTPTGLIVKINDPAPVHVTGLCVHLGICRDTLCEYQKKLGFSDPITRAKQRCEEYAVNSCFEGKSGNKADFVLQNNFGWKNKTEVDTKGSMIVKTIYIDAEEKAEYEKHISEAINENGN